MARAGRRIAIVGVAFAWVLLGTPGRALAYPKYIAKGYDTCASCHYSPTGGGLANAYGHAVLEATLPNDIESEGFTGFRDSLSKPIVTGYDEDDGSVALQADAGFDTRLLALTVHRDVKEERSFLVIPMLAEAGAAVGLGPTLAYGTLGARRSGEGGRELGAFSREHWLLVRYSEEGSLRAGRIVLPFGLRIPDHTQYVREDFGFDKWSQSYALSLDHNALEWSLSVAPFVGDLARDPPRLMERGGAATFTYHVPAIASFGISALGALAEHYNRMATSLQVRSIVYGGSYVLGEAALQRRTSRDTDVNQTDGAGYLRAGWFVIRSLDIYAELGSRLTFGHPELTKARYTFGIDWLPIPWVEISPAAHLEETKETGMTFTALGQLHVFY